MMDLKIKRAINNWIMPALLAIILSRLIYSFIFFIAMVPSTSMLPTVHEGDRLLVTRIHDFSHLKRGDILLFEFNEPNAKKVILVKRLIGLPGDSVEIKKGEIYINGNRMEQDYATITDHKDYFPGSIKVPENQYLFLGDNRPGSFDSRFWENPFIPKDKIIGKAVFVIFPLNRLGVLK